MLKAWSYASMASACCFPQASYSSAVASHSSALWLRPRDDAHPFVQFAGFEIQCELTRERLEARAAAFHKDVSSVGKDAELRQGRLHLGKLLAKRSKSTAQAVSGTPSSTTALAVRRPIRSRKS